MKKNNNVPDLKPIDRRYRIVSAVAVLAIICFVLILRLFGDSEHKPLAILVALFFWLIAALVMLFSAPRHLLRMLRNDRGLLRRRKHDDDFGSRN
jgi:peptidoglycan/LPS O-acetylase OafA/YrhL